MLPKLCLPIPIIFSRLIPSIDYNYILSLQKLTKISSTVATALYTLANDGDPPKDEIKADEALVSVTQQEDCVTTHMSLCYASQPYSRAANNSRSSDTGRPKFANVWWNQNLGQTFCLANFLLQHLTISFTNKIWLSYTLLFRMYLCLYVRPNFPSVRQKWCPSWTYVLSR